MYCTNYTSIPKFNIALCDQNGDGLFDATHDEIILNSQVVKGEGLASFFEMLTPHGLSPSGIPMGLNAFAGKLEKALDSWFAPKVHALEEKDPGEVSIAFMLGNMFHSAKLNLPGCSETLKDFLGTFDLVATLPVSEYKTVTHSGRCEDGCSVPVNFSKFTNQVYIMQQLPEEMGCAVISYPLSPAAATLVNIDILTNGILSFYDVSQNSIYGY
jgi:hypothetical protein